MLAQEDEMFRLLMTVPDIGYYSALLMVSEIGDINSGNENLRLSVVFFIIVMDSGSLWESCAGALSTSMMSLSIHTDFHGRSHTRTNTKQGGVTYVGI